jgi:PKD domain
MNIKKILASAAASTLVVLGMGMFVLVPTVNAIPWTPTATGLDAPGFNVFTGVPGYGDESKFMRGRVSGSSTEFTDPVNDACAAGTQFSVQMYVHNAANQTLNNNGTGPGVARGTTVKVGVPATTADKVTGTISASNAASVNDTLTINCNGKTMLLSFVQNSAIQQRIDGSTAPVDNSIVTTGAPISSHGVPGDVWGCFDQRVIVYLKLEVKEVPTPPVSTGKCELVVVTPVKDKVRTVTAKVTGSTSANASIVGYEINWGDGTKSNKQEDTHTYAKDGNYKITTRVQVKFADGRTEWLGAPACNQEVTFKPGQPPVVPPVTPPTVVTTGKLVDTGAGSIAGIFTATTVGGAAAYQVFTKRRLNRG